MRKFIKAIASWTRTITQRGVKVTDREMNQINISYDKFHGEWNYLILPDQRPP